MLKNSKNKNSLQQLWVTNESQLIMHYVINMEIK